MKAKFYYIKQMLFGYVESNSRVLVATEILNLSSGIKGNANYAHLYCSLVCFKEHKFSSSYLDRVNNHSNPLSIALLDKIDKTFRLKRFHVLDRPYKK